MTTFYAWAIPANVIGKFADHTWITTYDNRINTYGSLTDIAAANEHLWMCWGSFHPRGGTLGSENGQLPLAQCLVLDNADSVHIAAARGTIQLYGIEGVCHQVANQILFAIAGGGTPLSVQGARGYVASVHIYGQYGLAHAAWRAKVASCGGGGTGTGTGTGSGEQILAMTDGGAKDDLVDRAQDVLADRADLLEQLLAMRQVHQANLKAQNDLAPPSAEEINARNRAHMDQVAKLLGQERFVAIFGYDPSEEMNLVDPAIFAASQGSPPSGD